MFTSLTTRTNPTRTSPPGTSPTVEDMTVDPVPLIANGVPVKQLLRWQDDGGAVHAEVASSAAMSDQGPTST